MTNEANIEKEVPVKELHITVGLPRSGKSTWAREQGFPIVNPDSIRIALHGMRFVPEAEDFVWATTFVMIRSLLIAGHNKVVVDATNTTKKARDMYRKKFKDCLILWEVIETSKEECMRRAKEENDSVIIPVIERMADQFEEVE